MKKNILTILLAGIGSVSFSQKVDLDKFYYDVSYQKLPQEPVLFEQRTYSVSAKVGGAVSSFSNSSDAADKVEINGWKKVSGNATVTVEIFLEDFVAGESKLESRIEDIKDKNGKVTGRVTYYKGVSKFITRGYAAIKGPVTIVPPSAKELEEKAKKEEAVSNNRFLKNAVISKPAESADAGPLRINLSETLVHATEETTDAKKASLDLENNRSAVYDAKLREFVLNAIKGVNGRINHLYGFTPQKNKELLWIMDANNEEGKTQMEAINAVKAIFADMKADQPIDVLVENLLPLIEYFNSLKTKYNSADKAGRKIRYSSYYNLAKIYLSIDQPEKAIKEAEALIANDYDTKDGKNLIESAEQLIAEFQKAKIRTRHNISLK